MWWVLNLQHNECDEKRCLIFGVNAGSYPVIPGWDLRGYYRTNFEINWLRNAMVVVPVSETARNTLHFTSLHFDGS